MNKIDEVQVHDSQVGEVLAEQPAPLSRSSETAAYLFALALVWLMPFIKAGEAGGLGSVVMTWFGFISAGLGALVLFLPLRLVMIESLDGKKKLIPRIILFGLFGLMLVYGVYNLKPGYTREMEDNAYAYYNEHPQEFADGVEGETISIDMFSGPYMTFFIYTKIEQPERPRGGIVIDFRMGGILSVFLIRYKA